MFWLGQFSILHNRFTSGLISPGQTVEFHRYLWWWVTLPAKSMMEDQHFCWYPTLWIGVRSVSQLWLDTGPDARQCGREHGWGGKLATQGGSDEGGILRGKPCPSPRSGRCLVNHSDASSLFMPYPYSQWVSFVLCVQKITDLGEVAPQEAATGPLDVPHSSGTVVTPNFHGSMIGRCWYCFGLQDASTCYWYSKD